MELNASVSDFSSDTSNWFAQSMCDIYIMRYGWEWKNHNNHMEFKIYLFIDSKWFDSAFYAYAVEILSPKK